MGFGRLGLAKPFQRHTKTSMQASGIAPKRHRRHIGVAAWPELAVAPIAVAKAVEQVIIVRIAFHHRFHQRNGFLIPPRIFDNRAFGKSGKLPVNPAITNALDV